MVKQTHNTASLETASLIVGSLISCGVRKFAYCSGSRNAPFAYALARYEQAGLATVCTFAEERGAGFWAVGALQGAKDADSSVAVITTSGTAVSELHPAIEEAKYLSLPLVVVTADRPFELQGVGANQTTEQNGIFGASVVADAQIPAIDDPDDPGMRRAITSRVRRLTARGSGHGGLPGPVHLNVCLREPLAPGNGTTSTSTSVVELPSVGPSFSSGTGVYWSQVVDPTLRTVVVAGDGPGKREGSHTRLVAEYASELGIPIIAEPSSGLCDLVSWLPHGPLVADRLLRDLENNTDESVEQIIVVGRPTLSREVERLLGNIGGNGTKKIVVSPSERWQDVTGTATDVVSDLLPDPNGESEASFDVARRNWQQYCRQIAADVETVVREESRGLGHLGAARMIWRHSRDISLWLAASNVIRSFDLGASAPGARSVYSNRGLAGIDGTIASALGLQQQLGTPVRAVLGDLSFTYDLPSLSARPSGDQDIQLIVFEDGGGSIFHSLEHGPATDWETYQKYFGIPQSLDVCAVAQACGWKTESVQSIEELRAIMVSPVKGRSLVRIPLELPTERFEAVRTRASLLS
ncbi:2-succinyl-5-enolpyruvyl-6-hydroxy-3-cyclohexene-1-carboxylic-acid synthase [Actinomycetaceae bacterium MB13-C1-2]|nr:2-succinyl-5-enolpyruvyl-6-hydroxy-3-cyclohexene-1-carboxylic-acid synthase [Actinomycetaceae bacterium MB13-C1-2]